MNPPNKPDEPVAALLAGKRLEDPVEVVPVEGNKLDCVPKLEAGCCIEEKLEPVPVVPKALGCPKAEGAG